MEIINCILKYFSAYVITKDGLTSKLHSLAVVFRDVSKQHIRNVPGCTVCATVKSSHIICRT
jgi:hypothetical protein